MNQLNFIQRVIYILKRQYGFPLIFCRLVEEHLDFDTGKKIPTTIAFQINKVIILPDSLTKKFDYDLSFIAANRNFTYGGFYDTATRHLIIDKRDLHDYEIRTDDYFIYQGERWQVALVDDFEIALVLTVRLIKGSPLQAIYPTHLDSILTLTQTVVGVK